MSESEFSDYVVYVDESGDPNLKKINPNFPVFVLTLCVVKKEVYAEKIIPEMSKFKFRHFGHDMVVLHERDIRKQTGDFKGLLHQDKFLDELTEIIDASEMTLIGVLINKPALNKRYSNPYEPYSLAMEYGLERLRDFLKANSNFDGKKTFVICESRGLKEDKELELAFRRICDAENRNGERYPFSLKIVPKSINSNGLQLADLTARPIGLFVMRPDQQNRTYEILKKKFWMGRSGYTYDGNGLKVFPLWEHDDVPWLQKSEKPAVDPQA